MVANILSFIKAFGRVGVCLFRYVVKLIDLYSLVHFQQPCCSVVSVVKLKNGLQGAMFTTDKKLVSISCFPKSQETFNLD